MGKRTPRRFVKSRKAEFMEHRNQFTFYRSYYEALKELSKKEQASVLMAIIGYALDEEEPKLTGTAKAVFLLIKPTLDAGRRKAKSGQAGGKGKQSGSKPKAEPKQEPSEKEGEIEGEIEGEGEGEGEKEGEIEIEEESLIPTTPTPPPKEMWTVETPSLEDLGLAEVMNNFLNNIHSSPPPIYIDKLKCYVGSLGGYAVNHAIDVARMEGGGSWNFLEAILQRYSREGIKTPEDVARDEKRQAERRQAREDRSRKHDPPACTSYAPMSMEELEAISKMMGGADA